MKNIAIFASGSGSNAQRIIEYFDNKGVVSTKMLLCNKKDAYVLERVKLLNVPSLVFTRDDFYNSNKIIDLLKTLEIDLVVLAGFLWLLPENLVKAFPGRIINIHPALLPKYGGKGMYGHFVHEAVVANHEKESGITIHYVNEHYDKGDIIFQAKCQITAVDTPDSLAEKIHALEFEHFPKVIEKILTDNI
jgi:phosphoribosylglycinamide formyltransferase-1